MVPDGGWGAFFIRRGPWDGSDGGRSVLPPTGMSPSIQCRFTPISAFAIFNPTFGG